MFRSGSNPNNPLDKLSHPLLEQYKNIGGWPMVAHVATVAFLGLEARAVDVQVQVAPGMPKFLVVGLPDKAVGESRERVHAALAHCVGAVLAAAKNSTIAACLARVEVPESSRR